MRSAQILAEGVPRRASWGWSGQMPNASGDQEAIPPTPDDRALHDRLLARDPVAPSDLAEAHLEPLFRWLRRQFASVDPDTLEGIAVDLILSLAERPEQYKPDRLSLAGYLRMAARGDVRNALRSRREQSRHLTSLADVELAQVAGNAAIEGPANPADVVAAGESLDPAVTELLRSSFTPAEWPIVQLMLEGERRTAVYARQLGLAGSEIEQAREVKRVKDRLQKRLQRLAPRMPNRG
jgi:RNA polymerase sigma-70 factor (ECF subfamily)